MARAVLSRPKCLFPCVPRNHVSRQLSTQAQNWADRPLDVAKDNVAQLAASPRRPLTLTDLLKFVSRAPMETEAMN